MLQSSSIRLATPEDADGPAAWRLATLTLELLEVGATREVRLRAALLLAQCYAGRSAVALSITDGVLQRLITALGHESDADVRQVIVAALSCLSSRAEGAAVLARLSATLAQLIACVGKTPVALVPLADVAAGISGASAALAAGAVPAVIAFLSSPSPAVTGSVAAVAQDVQYPILRSRSPLRDALCILRTIAEDDAGRDAIITGGGTAAILRHLLSGAEARTQAAALGALASLAGSVPGLASLLGVAGAASAVPAVVALLESSDASVSALAFVAAQALAVSPVGRRQLCEALVGRPTLLLRVFPPPAAAASAELVAILCSPVTPPASTAAALALLLSIADPGMLRAGAEAGRAALDAMARVSCVQRLREIAGAAGVTPGPGGPVPAAVVAAAQRLLELGSSA